MTDALLLFGVPERDAALRHEVVLPIIDPLMFAEVDGRRAVLSTWLELPRLEKALSDTELLDMFELGLRELIGEGLTREAAEREVVARAVGRLGIERAIVPGTFPLALADRLRADNVEIAVDDEAVEQRRRPKRGHELEGVRAAQRAAEAAMGAAAALLRRAEPGPEGKLVVDGEVLVAERVRAELRAVCAEREAPAPRDIIVSSVWQGTGHEPGHGPLPAGLPIQIDLWPRDEESGCWADMTRTFVIGDPTPDHAERIAAQEEIVRAAIEDARRSARPGVTGRSLWEQTCERFEAAGWRTQRTGRDPEQPDRGFHFGLGHGVGLEVHEAPGLGMAGQETLVEGDVLAVEPGLWDPEIGGVRFEDLLLVTAEGCETLTDYPYDLRP